MTKEAEANYQAQYRALHRERLREYRARYQILKADKLRDQKARNYLRNKRSILAANKARYLKNKARYLQIAAKYYDANKIAVKGRVRAYAVRNRVKRNQYQKKRRTKDLNFKLAMSLRNRVNSALQQARSGKSARTPHLVGCDLKTLVAHLEAQFQPGMTWKNWAGKGWHIDHIRPCASFDLTDPEHKRPASITRISNPSGAQKTSGKVPDKSSLDTLHSYDHEPSHLPHPPPIPPRRWAFTPRIFSSPKPATTPRGALLGSAVGVSR